MNQLQEWWKIYITTKPQQTATNINNTCKLPSKHSCCCLCVDNPI